MRLSTVICFFVVLLLLASRVFAETPPMPPMTNGDGNPANNGMKHAGVELSGGVVSVHVASVPPSPVRMASGFGRDFTPAKFDVLENVYFNAQHGWLPEGLFTELPAGASIWIERTSATQPPGSTFRVFDGGNGMEGMAAWSMEEIYASDGDRWQWDGRMQHDYFTADQPGLYAMEFQVYVGDSTGAPLPGFTPGTATLALQAVPEPAGLLGITLGVAGWAATRRRRAR